jgi:hypothetical protein
VDTFLNRPFAPPGELDLYPRRRWPRVAATKFAPPTPLPDWKQDFNGRPRLPGSVGAYSGSGSNPGWLPQLERKPD